MTAPTSEGPRDPIVQTFYTYFIRGTSKKNLTDLEQSVMKFLKESNLTSEQLVNVANDLEKKASFTNFDLYKSKMNESTSAKAIRIIGNIFGIESKQDKLEKKLNYLFKISNEISKARDSGKVNTEMQNNFKKQFNSLLKSEEERNYNRTYIKINVNDFNINELKYFISSNLYSLDLFDISRLIDISINYLDEKTYSDIKPQLKMLKDLKKFVDEKKVDQKKHLGKSISEREAWEVENEQRIKKEAQTAAEKMKMKVEEVRHEKEDNVKKQRQLTQIKSLISKFPVNIQSKIMGIAIKGNSKVKSDLIKLLKPGLFKKDMPRFNELEQLKDETNVFKEKCKSVPKYSSKVLEPEKTILSDKFYQIGEIEGKKGYDVLGNGLDAYEKKLGMFIKKLDPKLKDLVTTLTELKEDEYYKNVEIVKANLKESDVIIQSRKL